MAAVLACGAGAVLSHGDAAVLWGMLRPLGGPVHVSVRSSGGRARQRGIRVHRCASLVPRPGIGTPTTIRLGIPVTSPARTIGDLRDAVAPRLERRARRQAEVLGLLDDLETASDRTRSDLELRFLRLCRSRGVPRPEVNARVAGLTVDFAWPEARLVVETDGYAYHRGRSAFEDDRARGVQLREHGYDLIRVADRQLRDEPARVMSLVADSLRLRLPAP
jgi:very-short-patch-repair endonuclease